MIINCAAATDFKLALDVSTQLNVSGPLKLLKLAEECKSLDSFCQMSSCFSLSDKTGFMEEKLYESSI
jgi:dTDP-4-dehydrorhamnose reductase